MRGGERGLARLRRARGFVVASDEAVRTAIVEVATAAGVGRLDAAVDSAAAFSDLLRLHPQLIFIDVACQPLDGFAFANLVRSAGGEALGRVPILLVAEQATSAQVSSARKVGADLLLRPLVPAALRARLIRHLDGDTPFGGAGEA